MYEFNCLLIALERLLPEFLTWDLSTLFLFGEGLVILKEIFSDVWSSSRDITRFVVLAFLKKRNNNYLKILNNKTKCIIE